jgi:hypothetical protein
MNANHRRVPPGFAPEVQFEVTPGPSALFRARQDAELELLKRQLLQDRLGKTWDSRYRSSLRRAANDAAALAWITPYPLLVFPVLFDEQAETAERHALRQKQVRERSREKRAA